MFQVSIPGDHISNLGLPTWLTTSTLQINSDDEEYEFGEEEEEDDEDEGSEEDDLAPDGAAGGEEEDGDDDTFVLAGVTSHGLDEK